MKVNIVRTESIRVAVNFWGIDWEPPKSAGSNSDRIVTASRAWTALPKPRALSASNLILLVAKFYLTSPDVPSYSLKLRSRP
jgi:hypothetical protein